MARPAASPEQRDRQRNRIRRAAAEVHAEKGLTGVSARAIALRAGVSTGTLYRYFPNLQELMRSLWAEPVAEADRELETTAREHPDPLDRIRALLTSYAEFAHANPEIYRSAFLLVRPDSLPKPERQPLHQVTFFRLLNEAVREGQLAGRIVTGDAEQMTQLLWAGLHGAIGLPTNIDAYAVSPSEQLAPAMIRALTRSIEA